MRPRTCASAQILISRIVLLTALTAVEPPRPTQRAQVSCASLLADSATGWPS